MTRLGTLAVIVGQQPAPSPAPPAGPGDVSPVEQLEKTFTSLYVGLLEGIPRLLVAVVVVAVFFLVGRLTRRILRPRLARLRTEAFAGVVSMLVFLGIVFLGFMIAIPIAFKVNAGALLGGASVLALAAGFAFQDIASNLMAGVLLVIREPFRSGDQIEVNGHRGTVRDINLRETRIMSFDGHLILIPNKDVYMNDIDIQTAENRVRSDLAVGVGYDTDLSQARALALDVLAGVDGVLDDPAPQAYFVEFGSSSMNLDLRYWTGSEQAEVRRVQDRVVEAVYDAFNAAGIDLPFEVVTLDAGETFERALSQAVSRAGDGSGSIEQQAGEAPDGAGERAGDGSGVTADRGDQAGDRLSDLSREELYERARQLGVSGRSRMSRSQLLQALEDRIDAQSPSGSTGQTG